MYGTKVFENKVHNIINAWLNPCNGLFTVARKINSFEITITTMIFQRSKITVEEINICKLCLVW